MSDISMKKKVLFVTNSRSEMTTVLSMLSHAVTSEVIDPYLMVGGTHFSEKYGMTVDFIKGKGYEPDFEAKYYTNDEDLPYCLGNAMPIFCDGIKQLNPDLVVVTGDRLECLPLITACLLSNILLAHVSGGDTTLGAIDNQIRDMLTKASHVHFVAMERHKCKLVKMGEHPKSIFVTGDPAIDEISKISVADIDKTLSSFGLEFDGDYSLCTFHPQTVNPHQNKTLLKNMLAALKKRTEFKIFTFPNGDQGSDEVINSLHEFVSGDARSAIIKSFNGEEYYKVLAGAKYIIGNSSSAIWECPTLKIPSINIGSRQKGRIRVNNVVDVDGLDQLELETALREVNTEKFSHEMVSLVNPYGDGKAGKRVVSILEELQFELLLELKDLGG